MLKKITGPAIDWILEAFGVCTSRRRLDGITRISPSLKVPDAVVAFKNGGRSILCLDGGGVRGIVTLHALKALEEKYSRWENYGFVSDAENAGLTPRGSLSTESDLPKTGRVGDAYLIDDYLYVWKDARCLDMFDMFAGTSTGAIIAGALAWGMSVDDLITFYREKHRIIFTRSKVRLLGGALVAVVSALACSGLGLIGTAAGALVGGVGGYYFTVPWYDHSALIYILKSAFGDDTLAHCHRDLLITSKDTVLGETVHFTAFHSSLRPSDDEHLDAWLQTVRGTYKDVPLHAAIAASAASAPIYFKAIGRFVDGGVGSFNNVSYAAPVEALRFSAKPIEAGYFNDLGNRDPQGKWPIYRYPADDQLYTPGKVKVLSFGTGKEVTHMAAGKAGRVKTLAGWLLWLINEFMDDASEQQSYIAHNDLDEYQGAITFQRFQLYWSKRTRDELQEVIDDPRNELAIKRLPEDLDEKELRFDAVKHFALLEDIGKAYGKWLNLPWPDGSTPRFELEGSTAIGHPVRSNPHRFHVDAYSTRVKDELSNDKF